MKNKSLKRRNDNTDRLKGKEYKVKNYNNENSYEKEK